MRSRTKPVRREGGTLDDAETPKRVRVRRRPLALVKTPVKKVPTAPRKQRRRSEDEMLADLEKRVALMRTSIEKRRTFKHEGVASAIRVHGVLEAAIATCKLEDPYLAWTLCDMHEILTQRLVESYNWGGKAATYPEGPRLRKPAPRIEPEVTRMVQK